MTKNYVDRAALVAELAPPAPPCFQARDQWITYLQSAAEHQRERHMASPLIFKRGQPVQFNREMFFCCDCNAKQAHAMTLQKRCKPDYLMSLPALIAAATAPVLEEDQC